MPYRSLATLLAARAKAEPDTPWLFYRRGWEWRWRSYGQVADQVARGVAALAAALPERSRSTADGASVDLAVEVGADPDALAALLAVRAAGLGAVFVEREGAPAFAAPPCRSRLDGETPLALEPHAETDDGDLLAAAAAFGRAVPPLGRHPILCASADLAPSRWPELLAWSLERGIAWALEPDREALPQAVSWTRPSLLVLTPRDLATVGDAGRRSRLVVVLVDGEVDGETDRANPLGVPCRRLPS